MPRLRVDVVVLQVSTNARLLPVGTLKLAATSLISDNQTLSYLGAICPMLECGGPPANKTRLVAAYGLGTCHNRVHFRLWCGSGLTWGTAL
jgi:hypothetical protein